MDAKQFINKIKSGVGAAKDTYMKGRETQQKSYKTTSDNIVNKTKKLKQMKKIVKSAPKPKRQKLPKKVYGGGASSNLKNLSIGLSKAKMDK